MLTAYLILLAALIFWKGHYAFLRAINSYRKDRLHHDSLREYLLANGATPWQSLWPFYRHALQRAFLPLLSQWRLWSGVLLLGALVLLLRNC
jgi:ABC-type iron transport system FetAB permease component